MNRRGRQCRVREIEAFPTQSSAVPHPRALRMPTKRPAQKNCRFKRVRCPPTAFPAAIHLERRRRYARLERQLQKRVPPAQRTFILADRRTELRSKPTAHVPGQKPATSGLPPRAECRRPKNRHVGWGPAPGLRSSPHASSPLMSGKAQVSAQDSRSS
jgi:hypothetical protein